MSREELKNAEERADKDFDRAIAAVTAGEKLDQKMVSELLGSNKEEILALARKEGDVKGAMFKVMEDAVDSLKEYDKLVDKAVADSGYTGIVADGLRDSLLKERTRVFGEALRQSAGPRVKRNLENDVRGKILAEASKQVAALAETVGPAELANRTLSEEQVRLARSYAEALNKADEMNTKMTAAVKRLNKLRKAGNLGDDYEAAVQEDDQYSEAWNGATANAKRVAKLLETAGVSSTSPEFATKAARAELSRTLPEYVGGYRVAKPDSMEIIDEEEEDAKEVLEPAREIPFPRREDRQIVERVRPGAVKEGPGMPLEQAIVDTGEHDPRLDEPRRRAAAKRREMNPTRMEDYDAPTYVGDTGPDEIPDVTDLLQDDEPPKKGFLQGLAKNGRKLMLGMALLFGMKAGAPDQRLPHQEDQGPSRETAAMMANMETMAAPVRETTGVSGETQAEEDQSATEAAPKVEGDVEYKKGDPRNLKRALKILKDSGLKGRAELALEKHQNLQGALQAIDESGLPGKAEFQKMKAKERREEVEAAMGRIEAMRLIGDMKSPVLDAVKRADLRKKLDQHQAFLDAMRNLDEVK